MAYAILRTTKLKSFGEIGGSLAHTFRDRETPNADPTRTPLNAHWGARSSAEALAAIRGRLPEKHRSDAVLCIEYFVGRSPDWNGDDGAYFKQAREWLVERHGAQNVVSAHVHRDEKTPHMVAYVVPRDGDGLNAKKWLGGKKVLSAMQTEFWELVGRQHHLDRGIEGSVARHQTVKEFYAAVDKTERALKVQVPRERRVLHRGLLTNTFETDEAFASRVAATVQEQMLPAAMKGLEADQAARREREQAREVGRLRKALQGTQERLDRFERIFEGLSAKQIDALLLAAQNAAHKMRHSVREVVGWLKALGPTRRGGEWQVTVEERGTGRVVTMAAHSAGQDLHRDGVRRGDLVKISSAGGQIIERSRGLERGT